MGQSTVKAFCFSKVHWSPFLNLLTAMPTAGTAVRMTFSLAMGAEPVGGPGGEVKTAGQGAQFSGSPAGTAQRCLREAPPGRPHGSGARHGGHQMQTHWK